MNISDRRDSKYEGLAARKFWECSRTRRPVFTGKTVDEVRDISEGQIL